MKCSTGLEATVFLSIWKCFLTFIFWIIFNSNIYLSEKVSIKIANDIIPKWGKSLSNGEEPSINSESDLNMKAAQFSGPSHFKDLARTCFSYIDIKYNYVFCPFQNITQEEVDQSRYKSREVLGIWGEWIIENNNFIGFRFIRGSKCAPSLQRSIEISIKCGSINEFKAVTEPKKCHYEGEFSTPLSCGTHAMTVYPRLGEDLQREWDVVETKKHFNMITQTEYAEELNNIFKAENLFMSDEKEKKLVDEANENYDCKERVESLQSTIKDLEAELKSKNRLLKVLKRTSETLPERLGL